MNHASPDLIVVNAHIRTMDALHPHAEALAVKDGRVWALGTDAEIRSLANGTTRLVDAQGRLVLPGFQDTHIHLQDSGTARSMSVALDGITDLDKLLQRLAEHAAANPDEPWVRGSGYYTGVFGEHNLSRQVLDAVVPDRPCWIYGSDGHNACLNTLACKAVGLDETTPDPHNGQFVRDAQGVPTGLLYEDALFWVQDRMPPLDDGHFKTGVRYAQALCNRHGITGVLDARVGERHMRVYKDLADAGELTVRIRATALVTPEDTVHDALERIERLRRDFTTPMSSVHSAKFFLDGVFENRTAAMIEDYSDEIGGNAPVMFEAEHLRELFIAFDKARFQLHAHCIGDGAVRACLDALQAAREANGEWPALHQVAHIQVIDPADIPRFRELGAVANIQPLWARNEPSVTDIALPMVGEQRGRYMYAWATLRDAGAIFAVSSDWGVSTLNPFEIMAVAVTRKPPRKFSNHPVFLPEERITVEDVVRGYTLDAAASAWRSADTGSLGLGKFADLIILDRDIFTIAPEELADTQVLLTLLAGQEVHRDPALPA
ncbi:hypothetical protein FHS85_004774 [Rhodoligotrophos appendicifer]|uniref:amidohydrolase n=1 Tax=Rhodoligotrophos appendicifer TaxID=987056 RepID=UPI001185F8F0|nr:amidohydrolase [Rhodoligotrophos appendicifer]